jgi:serine/threonine protein kinase
MAERRIMAQIRHPFIVPLIFAFQSTQKLYMVTEYCSGGELFFHLKRLKRFGEKDARFYAAEVACALAHLHSFDVIYRDLKPENILLDASGHVKLTDFGLSKDRVGAAPPDGDGGNDSAGGDGITRTFCGTPEYLAPEMILNRKRQGGYSKAVDWWSLGIVLFEMLTGLPPFYDRNFNTMCEKILRKPVRFPSKFRIGPEAQDFVGSLLQRDPSYRLGNTAEGFAAFERHPLYRGLDWGALRRREIKPPFVPLRGRGGRPEDDTRNIDREFLRMEATDTPVQRSALHGVSGSDSNFTTANGSARNPCRVGSQGGVEDDELGKFADFSFVDSALDRDQ